MKAPAAYKLVQFFWSFHSLQSISGVRSSATEFPDVDEERLPLRLLTDDEVAQLDELGMPMSQAAQVFNRKLARAKKMLRERNPTESSEQGMASQVDDSQENRREAPPMQFDERKKGKAGKFSQILDEVAPKVAIQLCVQLNVNLDYLLPGMVVSFGLLGSLTRNYDNGCWAVQFEVSIGIGWGFKVLGFSLGVGGVFAGTVDLVEVPIASAALEKGSTLDVNSGDAYAPDGANLTQCHTMNPWMIVQTWIEQQAMRNMNEGSVHEKSKELQQKTVEAEREAIKMYKGLVTSDYDVRDGGKSLHWPKLSLPAVALFRALGEFLKRVPAYADQIMSRLVDNSKGLKGIFGMLWGKEYRYDEAKGRFWARWPSSADLEEWLSACETSDDEEKDDCLGPEPVVGIDVAGKGNDQRVFNFARVLRQSKHTSTIEFWKEIAISASNFFIRIIGDVVALFNMAFVGTPRWDGDCDSLRPSFTVGKWQEGNKEWDKHPWASKYRGKPGRRQFASRTKDSQGNPYERVLWALPDTDTDSLEASTMYPRLWCCLAEQTPGDGTRSLPQKDIHDIKLFVPQACETVTTKTRKLIDSDRIQWNAEDKVYVVFRPDNTDGILVDPSLQRVPLTAWGQVRADASDDEILKLARVQEYLVATKDVSSRLECERVLIPGPFVRIFSAFVKFVQHRKAAIELDLGNIHECLSEQIWNNNKRSHIKNVLCTTQARRHEYVSDTARHILRIVRRFVIALGAEDPRVAVHDFQEGGLSLDKEEVQALALAKERFAPVVTGMADDFIHGFNYENHDVMINAHSIQLTGAFWLHAPSVVDKLLEISSDVSTRVAKIPNKWLRPPVRYMYSLKFSLQSLTSAQASFCTPNTALFLITPVHVAYLRKTWSAAFAKERCMMGRTRVGDFFIMVSRCYGADYTDWRIKYFGVIIKGNILGADRSGMLGNILTHGTSELGALKAGVIASGVLLGGLASYKLVDKFKPYVHKHPAITALIMMAAEGGPLLGAAAGATIVSESTFTDICKTVLQYLSEHGVVKAPSVGEPTSLSPVKIDMALVLHTALVFREKQVEYKIVPPGYTPGKALKLMSFISVTGESWNRFDLIMPIPSIGGFEVHAQLDIRLDLTRFAEYKMNMNRWERNQKRVQTCFCCLLQKEGFCDWKIALGTPLWTKKLDKCVSPSTEEIRKCTGAKTDEEHQKSSGGDGTYVLPGSGVFYSPQNGPSICAHMDFRRSNSDPVANEILRMFLRQVHARRGTSPTQIGGGKPWGNWSAQLPDASVCSNQTMHLKSALFAGVVTIGAGAMCALWVFSFKGCVQRRRRLKEERRAGGKIQDPAHRSTWGIELRDHAYESSDDETPRQMSRGNVSAAHEKASNARSRRANFWQRIGATFGSFSNADVDTFNDALRANQSSSFPRRKASNSSVASSGTPHSSDGSPVARSPVARHVRARAATAQISQTTSQAPVLIPRAPSAPSFGCPPAEPRSFTWLPDQRTPTWLPQKSESLYAPRVRETSDDAGVRSVSLHARQAQHMTSVVAGQRSRSLSPFRAQAHSDPTRNAFIRQFSPQFGNDR